MSRSPADRPRAARRISRVRNVAWVGISASGRGNNKLMKIRVAGSDEYVSLSRARWLVTARRARFFATGELQIFARAARRDETVRWTAYSNVGLPNPARAKCLRGVLMNGAAMRTDEA